MPPVARAQPHAQQHEPALQPGGGRLPRLAQQQAGQGDAHLPAARELGGRHVQLQGQDTALERRRVGAGVTMTLDSAVGRVVAAEATWEPLGPAEVPGGWHLHRT